MTAKRNSIAILAAVLAATTAIPFAAHAQSNNPWEGF
jgi:hypothetical protein